MVKNNKKKKGDRGHDKGIIPFFNDEAFPDAVDKSAEETNKNDPEVIELTLPLDTDKSAKKDNAYAFVMEHVKTLEGNVEQVISTIDKLTNEVMTQKDFELHSEYVRVYQNYLKAIFKGNALDTWKEVLLNARKRLFKKFTKLDKDKSETRKKFAVSIAERDKIIMSHNKFFAWLKKKLAADEEEYSHFDFTSAEKYQDALAQHYEAMTKNYLNRAVFGDMNHHKAFEKQVRYLETGIVKPMKATINQTFSRIETLIRYLSYFLPTSNVNDFPDFAEHARFQQILQPDQRLIKTIMYSCLPEEAFKKKVEETLSPQGKDHYQITISEFKQLCNGFERIDNEEREKQARAKAALQAKIPKKENTAELASRADLSRNSKALNNRQRNKATWQGTALNCAWCKEKGKSEAAYTSHTEDKCFLKNPSLRRQLSGGMRGKEVARSAAKKEIRAYKKKIKKQKKELRKLKYKKRKSSRKRKRKSEDSSEDDVTLNLQVQATQIRPERTARIKRMGASVKRPLKRFKTV